MHIVQRLFVSFLLIFLGGLPIRVLESWSPLTPLIFLVVVGTSTFFADVIAHAFFWRTGPGQCATPATHQEPLTPDLKDKVVTYFYPGLGASWRQALRYLGKEGFPMGGVEGLTGLRMPSSRIANAPRLLYSIIPINPPEVLECEYTRMRSRPLAWFWGVTGVASLINSARHGIEGFGNPYFIEVPLVNFAQRGDTNKFLTGFRGTINDDVVRGRTPILAGSSRGASTVLCAVTLVTPEEQANLGFVLLEGAFDTVPNVARARFGRWLGLFVAWALPWVTSYDSTHATPLDMARSFPANVPVAFVTSKADTVVPMAHTLALRDAVVAARGGDETHVHTLILEKSSHSTYANEDLDDQRRYREFMDTLYRQYVLS